MKRLTGLEFCILLMAVSFIGVGIYTALYPTETVVIHQVYRHAGISIENISKTGARVYGVLATLLGIGFVWMVFYGRGG
jgi:hypothetical protein